MIMKKLLLVLLLMSITPLVVAKGEEPALHFDTMCYDFGDVQHENKSHTCHFSFENRGEEPIVLLSVQTSCSCLKADYSRRPVRAGEKGDIAILLEASKVDVGVFHRVIKVQTNKGLYLLTVKGHSVE